MPHARTRYASLALRCLTDSPPASHCNSFKSVRAASTQYQATLESTMVILGTTLLNRTQWRSVPFPSLCSEVSRRARAVVNGGIGDTRSYMHLHLPTGWLALPLWNVPISEPRKITVAALVQEVAQPNVAGQSVCLRATSTSSP